MNHITDFEAWGAIDWEQTIQNIDSCDSVQENIYQYDQQSDEIPFSEFQLGTQSVIDFTTYHNTHRESYNNKDLVNKEPSNQENSSLKVNIVMSEDEYEALQMGVKFFLVKTNSQLSYHKRKCFDMSTSPQELSNNLMHSPEEHTDQSSDRSE